MNLRERQVQAALAAAIVDARQDAGLTAEDVWRAAGISRPTYGRIEQRKRKVYSVELDAIARAIGTTADALHAAADAAIAAGKFTPEKMAAEELRRAVGRD